MSNKENFWLFFKISSILMWILLIWLWIGKDLWYIFVIMAFLHILEVVGKKHVIGVDAGDSKIKAILFTLIFGFGYWLPIQKNAQPSES